MTISIGAHRIDGDGVEYRINKIVTHPAYGVAYHRNDIALLRLVKPVKLDSKVGTVCFPPKGSRVAPGTRCWISGSSAITQRKHIQISVENLHFHFGFNTPILSRNFSIPDLQTFSHPSAL